MYKFLDGVNSPGDIKKFNVDELGRLCSEIRNYMVDCCAVNPGHLASSLGAVELIVGIHKVFNTPEDKLVFDVGHQAYAHKIITGRRDIFKYNRTRDGISGFPKMSESPYDAFGVGHSSTSISAALGYAEAARIIGSDRQSIALIGDGALTGGMAFEALNNAGTSKSNILIVLNDNDHSIDEALGGLHDSLLRMTTDKRYNLMKARIWDSLGESGFRKFLQRWSRSLKSWLVKSSGGDLFESLGIRYFGPIDGNDIVQVASTLEKLHDIEGPRLLHCITTKGYGYAPAEKDPTVWHAPGKFNPETGERICSPRHADRYQDVFGKVLCELGNLDNRVVGITPAMASGCGMTGFAEKFPERFFDVGIEEEHAVTFSAGLAAGGLRPFCNIYSAFSQRAYDQIIHDVALQELPVVLCFDRAGLVGEDGATHHGAFDMAAYRSVPNAIVSSPMDEIELKNLMYTALRQNKGPFIIRYPRGMGEGVEWKSSAFEELPIGRAVELRAGSRVAVIATGHVCNRAMEAASEFGRDVAVYNFRFVKPLDCEMLEMIAAKFPVILTLEDGAVTGGLFGAVSEFVASRSAGVRVICAGIPDRFIEQDRQDGQREECGLSSARIADSIRNILEKD